MVTQKEQAQDKRSHPGSQGRAVRYPTQAVETMLSDLAFPATKNQVRARAGKGLIKLGSGEEIELSEILAGSPLNEFGSLSDVVEEVGRLLENPNHVELSPRKQG